QHMLVTRRPSDSGSRGLSSGDLPGRGLLGRSWVRCWLPAVVLLSGYFAFNLVLGGTPLPGTFAAKTACYRDSSRTHFLSTDVGGTYFWGGWIVLLPFALGSILSDLGEVLRRRVGRTTLESTWMVALPLSYFVM